jgi:invasion protein IalB
MIVRNRLLALTGWAAGLAALAGPAAAQPQSGQAYEDWQVRCARPNETAPEQCHIGQTVVTKENGKPFLYIGVGYAPDRPDGPVLLVTVPLGIHLPSGVTLQIDQGQPLGLLVERCDRNGCHAGLALDGKTLASMQKGLMARVSIRDSARNPVKVPISLKGFTAGLAALR